MTIPASPPLSFMPTADAFVAQDQPSTNFGTATSLQIDGSPLKKSLFRFSVNGVGTSGISSAKLRIYCTNASAIGGEIRSVTGAWTEGGVTWNTSPVIRLDHDQLGWRCRPLGAGTRSTSRRS